MNMNMNLWAIWNFFNIFWWHGWNMLKIYFATSNKPLMMWHNI
jgi:hypothetical protein